MSYEQKHKFNKIMYKYSVAKLMQSSCERIEVLKKRRKSHEYLYGGGGAWEPGINEAADASSGAGKKSIKFAASVIVE